MSPISIGYVGTDGRTFMAALDTSRATSERYSGAYRGYVVRGTPAMPPFAQKMGWPVDFLPTSDNSVEAYAQALIQAFADGILDLALIMPEGLIFQGLVDRVAAAGYGEKIIGPDSRAAFLEADKIACKHLCREAGIPVAPAWTEVDARDYRAVLHTCLDYLHEFGGAVLKYPYSAGGKGARIILNTWEIRDVYDVLISDYKADYTQRCGKKGPWPLLVEARMSGVEISFTILVDRLGHFCILPTAMDYPERFEGPPGIHNPITGGMGSISPHPLETPDLLTLAEETIARPLVQALQERGLLRPLVLYPGCFVSFGPGFRPREIRVCEVNIRPGEPEFQPVVKRLRNLGPLVAAMAAGKLNEVKPEVRADQISLCLALVTGPGGPQQQKGYPWSLTKGEPLLMDFAYFDKKKITVIPSALDYDGETFRSDGSRVAYLVANATLKPGQKRGQVAETLRQRLLNAYDQGKIRVIPRENQEGNRLALRRDIGLHYLKAELLVP
jgi:phosphoribosylamine--glycine ligase|uniref:ATP-grasp domain-containing protein n=1 Tax=Desulfobacca acetoxidans TaxID=60893 RepID=A0A7C5EVX1_9BACT